MNRQTTFLNSAAPEQFGWKIFSQIPYICCPECYTCKLQVCKTTQTGVKILLNGKGWTVDGSQFVVNQSFLKSQKDKTFRSKV